MLATQLNRTLYQLPPKASHMKPCHVAWQSLSLFPHPQHASCSPTSSVLGIPTSGVGYDTLASYKSCAARRYCGALSSSTRHKYLLGCMILSWTRSASSQGNHIDDSSSSHSPSAEMVVTHRWNPPESRPRHILIRRAHHRSPRDPTHRQQCLESQLRRGSLHADASCLRLGSGAVRLVGAGDNQLDCARLVSFTAVDDIQLVDQTNVALAIVPTSSNDGDRFSLCCQTYERERERERESIESIHMCGR